jgi:hypothetical protein
MQVGGWGTVAGSKRHQALAREVRQLLDAIPEHDTGALRHVRLLALVLRDSDKHTKEAIAKHGGKEDEYVAACKAAWVRELNFSPPWLDMLVTVDDIKLDATRWKAIGAEVLRTLPPFTEQHAQHGALHQRAAAEMVIVLALWEAIERITEGGASDLGALWEHAVCGTIALLTHCGGCLRRQHLDHLPPEAAHSAS